MAHANIAFLPTDRAVWLTDLYPTDEEQRANNPAGQRGISTVTMGLCLGKKKESFGNVCANFAGDPMVDKGLLVFEGQLPTLPVPKRVGRVAGSHGSRVAKNVRPLRGRGSQQKCQGRNFPGIYIYYNRKEESNQDLRDVTSRAMPLDYVCL